MPRVHAAMTANDAIATVMRRVPAARGQNRNLGTRARVEKALNSFNAKQLCCIIDALWGVLGRYNPAGSGVRSTMHAYTLAVSFFAGKVAEKERTRSSAPS